VRRGGEWGRESISVGDNIDVNSSGKHASVLF
jgi:hypothetical protein